MIFRLRLLFRVTVTPTPPPPQKKASRVSTAHCRLRRASSAARRGAELREDGLRQARIPAMLDSLGLHAHHVIDFFRHMAEAANDDGQVETTNFVNGCMLLEGAATYFDLHKLHAVARATPLT